MLKKFITAFGVKSLGALATFLLSIVITQQLSVQEAGYYFLGLTVISILSVVAQFGSHSASLRYIGSFHADQGQGWGEISQLATGTKFIVALFSSCLAIALYFSTGFIANNLWQKPAMAAILERASLILFFTSLSILIAHHFQAINRTVTSITLLSIITPLGLSVVIILFDFTTASQAMLGLQIVSIANFLAASFLWSRTCVASKYRPKLIEFKPFIKTCSPLWVISIMAMLTTWSGQFIAGIWASAEDLACLAVAQRTALLVSFILVAVNMVTAPRFAALYHKKKHQELKSLAIQTSKFMTLFSIPIIIFLLIASNSIMSLFGDEYQSGSSLLIILALGQLTNVVTGSVGYLLNMTGHEKDMQKIIIISSLITILLTSTLTYFYGIIGSAIASSIGIGAQNLYAVWFVKQRLGFNTLIIWGKS